MKPYRFSLHVLLLVLSGSFVSAAPMGTAFIYQGQLDDGKSAANGWYDFEFQLYDAPTNGAEVASAIHFKEVPVLEGLFRVDLDFGAEPFAGEARWLQIGVVTNGGKQFVQLWPRQRIDPAPYAQFALIANSALLAQTAGSLAGSNLTAAAQASLALEAPTISLHGAHLTNTVTGNAWQQVDMNFEEIVGQNLNVTVGGAHQLTTGVDVTETIGRDRTTEVTRDYMLTVGRNHALSVGSSLSLQAGNNLDGGCSQAGSFQAGTELSLTAGDELFLQSGRASMAMKKNGDIIIKGNKISIHGSGDIVSPKGAALRSVATETNDTVVGIYGESGATNGIGVLGVAVPSANDDVHAGVLAVAAAGTKNLALLANCVTNDLLPEAAVPRPAAIAARAEEKQDLIQGYGKGNVVCFRVSGAGTVYAVNTAVQPVDLAERIPVSDAVEPAEVVEVDPDCPGAFRRARQAYSPRVAGVISTRPGFLLGHDESCADNASRPPLALAGRVPVKVSLEGGAIRPGDLLASASTPGHAMKAHEPWRGGIIGTALEAYHGTDGRPGQIEVLVHLAPGAMLSAVVEPLQARLAAQEARIAALEKLLSGK